LLANADNLQHCVNHREYREHVKDLSCLSKDLSRVVIVDNNPFSFLLQPLNGIPCVPFSARLPYDEQVGILSALRNLTFFNAKESYILHFCLFLSFGLCSFWTSSFHSSKTYPYKRMLGLFFTRGSTCLNGFKCMAFLLLL
jgi:RNA polymerase II subunit A small phosphatase-like protein